MTARRLGWLAPVLALVAAGLQLGHITRWLRLADPPSGGGAAPAPATRNVS